MVPARRDRPGRSVEFRDADLADLDAIVAAQRTTAALTYGDEATEATLVALAERTRRALAAPDPQYHRIRVATVTPTAEGKGVAYGWVERRGARTAHLLDLFVPEAWRGTGVAVALLEDLAALARSWAVAYLSLVVGAGNERALAFFGHHGASAAPDAEAIDGLLTLHLPLDP